MPAPLSEQAWLWLYGSNVLQSIRGEWCLGSLNHFWSLAVEEHFYFVWPLVIFLCTRQTALRVCGLIIVAAELARALWLYSGGNDVAAEVFTLLRMDSLVLGGWLALVARSPGGLAWLVKLAKPTLVISGVIAFGTWLLGKRLLGLPDLAWGGVLRLAADPDGLGGEGQLAGPLRRIAHPAVFWQIQLRDVRVPATADFRPGLARHRPRLGLLVRQSLARPSGLLRIMFGLTTLLALASWNCFEKHFLALKHRFGG